MSVQNYDLFTKNDIVYKIIDAPEDGHVMVCDAKDCKDKHIKIEPIINGYPVTSIGEFAFDDSQAESISIPDTVSVIHSFAFEYSHIKYLTLPENLIRIDPYAFANCLDLKAVKFNDKLCDISEAAFYSCKSLKKVNIGKELKFLSFSAFDSCTKLKEINIQSPLFSFIPNRSSNNFFSDVGCLQHFNIDKNHPRYKCVDGLLCDKKNNILLRVLPNRTYQTLKLPKDITSIERGAFSDVSKIDKLSISVPSISGLNGSMLEHVVIKTFVCPKNSAVEGWAKGYRYNVCFVESDINNFVENIPEYHQDKTL